MMQWPKVARVALEVTPSKALVPNSTQVTSRAVGNYLQVTELLHLLKPNNHKADSSMMQ